MVQEFVPCTTENSLLLLSCIADGPCPIAAIFLFLLSYPVCHFECSSDTKTSVSGEGEVFSSGLASSCPRSFMCRDSINVEAPRRFALLSEVQAAALGLPCQRC